MQRDNITEEEARAVILKDDAERRRWGLRLYGVDTWNSDNYDMVLNVGTMTVDDVVNLIVENVKRPRFETTSEAQKILDNLALAARVHAALVDQFPTADVSAREGRVFVGVKGSLSEEKKLTSRARGIVQEIQGVEEATVHFVPLMTPD
jgi:hypothetical protein